MKLYIDTGPPTVVNYQDYTQSVVMDSLVIEDSINVPTVINFTLVAAGDSFVLPKKASYVKIVSEIYAEAGGKLVAGQTPLANGKVLATGFITNEPEREYLGLNPHLSKTGFQQLSYLMNVTSDEWILNTRIVPFVPAFVNQTQGQILSSLAQALAPGFFDVSSFVASGDVVPYFQYDPQQTWADIAKTFADASRYRYKVINRKIYYQPFGDQALGVQYDETLKEKTFFPLDMKTVVVTVPPVNDALVLGAEEPQDKFDNYFIGDGFTSNFKLRNQMFRGASTLLLQDDWTENSFQTSLWTVMDPFGVFNLPGALNVVQLGQPGTLNQTYIVGKNGVELGGQLDVQTGEFQFVDVCEGIVGGIYVSTVLTQQNCIAGFNVTTPGTPLTVSGFAQGVVIQPIFNGQLVGPQVTSQLNHHYQLEIWFGGQNWARYQSAYRTLTGSAQYGGLTLESTSDITWVIRDINLTAINAAQYNLFIQTGGVGPPFAIKPLETKFTLNRQPLPSFGVYAPINSKNLNLTLNFTQVSQPPQGSLQVASLTGMSGGLLPVLPPSLWTATTPDNQKLGQSIQYTLGFGLANPTATITQSGEASFLSFFDDTIPGVGARIRFIEWANGQSMSRVQNGVAVAQEAVVSGDSGVRSAIMTSLQPQPRTSAECELAAAAAILDRSYPQFQGTYTIFTIPFRYEVALNPGTTDYPRSGRYFFVNAPVRAISGQNFFASTIRTQIIELREEVLQVEVSYGPDLYLEKLLAKFIQRPEPGILGPSEQQVPPSPIQLTQAGSFYVPMFASAEVVTNANGSVVTNSLTGNFITIDLHQIPVTAAEVRRVDSGWGQNDQNLIGLFTTQTFQLPRTSRDQEYFIRPRFGNQTSRFSYVARVNYPLIPSPPRVIGLKGTNLVLDFNGDVRDIYGVELRLPGVSGEFVLSFPITPTPGPPGPAPPPASTFALSSLQRNALTIPPAGGVNGNVVALAPVTVRPVTLLNGWGPNGHVGAYEHGINQNFNFFGLDSGPTNPYANPDSAVDASSATFASAIFQHTHQYAGVVWKFTGDSPQQSAVLNIDSHVPSNGEDGLTITARSAGIWYSLNSGGTWVQVYNTGPRARQIDSIPLPAGQIISNVQVMAFIDGHDDMAHYVYDINITTTSSLPQAGDIWLVTAAVNGTFNGLKVVTDSIQITTGNTVYQRLQWYDFNQPYPLQIGLTTGNTSVGTITLQARLNSFGVINGNLDVNNVATVQTAAAHGFNIGDTVLVGAAFTSLQPGQTWTTDSSFYTGQFAVTDTPAPDLFRFGLPQGNQIEGTLQGPNGLQGRVGLYQPTTNSNVVASGQSTDIFANGVLIQRPVFAPSDLIFDLGNPDIQDVLQIAQAINPNGRFINMTAQFFNLTWDYSAPVNIPNLTVPTISGLQINEVTHVASWVVVAGRPTGHRVQVISLNPGETTNRYTIDHPHNPSLLQTFQLTEQDFKGDKIIRVVPFDIIGDGVGTQTVHMGASVPASNAGNCVLNVMDFGAVGDGVTDDTLAIQKALDAALATAIHTVLIPCGFQFRITPQLQLASTSVLAGSGQWTCLLIKTFGSANILYPSLAYAPALVFSGLNQFDQMMPYIELIVDGTLLVDTLGKGDVWAIANYSALEIYGTIPLNPGFVGPFQSAALDSNLLIHGSGGIQPRQISTVTFVTSDSSRANGIWYDAILNSRIEDLTFAGLSISIRLSEGQGPNYNALTPSLGVGQTVPTGCTVKNTRIVSTTTVSNQSSTFPATGPNIGIDLLNAAGAIVEGNFIDGEGNWDNRTANQGIRAIGITFSLITKNIILRLAALGNNFTVDSLTLPQSGAIYVTPSVTFTTPTSLEISYNSIVPDSFVVYGLVLRAALSTVNNLWVGPDNVRVIGNNDDPVFQDPFAFGTPSIAWVENLDRSLFKENSFGWGVRLRPRFPTGTPVASGLCAPFNKVRFRDNQYLIEGPSAIRFANSGFLPTLFSKDSYVDDQWWDEAVTFWGTALDGNAGFCTGTQVTPCDFSVQSQTNCPISSNQVLFSYTFVAHVQLGSDQFTGILKASVGATNTATCVINQNGSQIGSLTFAAGGQGGAQTGTIFFFVGGVQTFVPGDVLQIVAPSSPDPTLCNITIKLVGIITDGNCGSGTSGGVGPQALALSDSMNFWQDVETDPYHRIAQLSDTMTITDGQIISKSGWAITVGEVMPPMLDQVNLPLPPIVRLVLADANGTIDPLSGIYTPNWKDFIPSVTP